MRKLAAWLGALALLGLCAAPANAQTAIGWLSGLSRSCWQGADANGAAVDRQCFQLQFGRFLRGDVVRGDLHASSVLGWDQARRRLELYSWSNRGQPDSYAASFDEGMLTMATADGRVVWRRVDTDNFQIATQVRENATWADRGVISYHRDGAASAAFEATASTNAHGSAQLGWVESLAGHCYHQTEPQNRSTYRGCLGWEYSNVLRETWYWGSAAASGETVLFRVPEGIKFFYWDAQGNFGIGDCSWDGAALYSTTDADRNRRTHLGSAAGGFVTTTEVRSGGSERDWEMDHAIRLSRD